jgi:hypothetical protein
VDQRPPRLAVIAAAMVVGVAVAAPLGVVLGVLMPRELGLLAGLACPGHASARRSRCTARATASMVATPASMVRLSCVSTVRV